MQRTQNEFGEIAYRAFVESRNWTSPASWDTVNPGVKASWNQAALAVLKAERAQAEGYPQVAHV